MLRPRNGVDGENFSYRRNEIIPFYVKVKDLDEISGYPAAIAFADEQTGYITVTYHGQDFSVYMSNDGGKNWHGRRCRLHLCQRKTWIFF